MSIHPIKAFSDNYIWAIRMSNSDDVVLVDPGQAAPCIDFISTHKLKLTAILITHHHADHTGGIEALKGYCKKHQQTVTVYGPDNNKISGVDHVGREKDVVKLPFNNNDHSIIDILTLSVLALPGHTLDHIAYVGDSLVFCGDTLFSGGCGRLFEGTAEQMLQSLNKLSALPASTKVYCTHEYTLSNLHFAKAVDPNNTKLQQYADGVKTLRENDQITLPSTIALETEINPFLRTHHHDIIQAATRFAGNELTTPVDVFATIRTWKDNF